MYFLFFIFITGINDQIEIYGLPINITDSLQTKLYTRVQGDPWNHTGGTYIANTLYRGALQCGP